MRLEAANDNIPIRYGPWLPTRKMAKERGARTYFTGKPCKHGHLTYRATTSGHCSACDAICDEERRKKPERRESIRRIGKIAQRRRREDPEVRAKERAYDRKRRLDPAVNERERLRMRERRKDPEYKAKEDAYRRAHPEMQAAINHRRRTRRVSAEGSHTRQDITAILESQKNRCAFCGVRFKKRSDWHLDHIIPLSKGGSNWPSNLQILCVTCNLEKHSLDPIEFAQRKGRLL